MYIYITQLVNIVHNLYNPVAGILRELGIEVIEGVGQTGLVGLIQGQAGPGACVGLRSDMDGLSVIEAPSIYNSEYISSNKRMHACGHDGHMSMLLAAAKVLQSERHLLKGTIKLIFQPNEENVVGARAQIKDGILEEGKGLGPRVDEMYGIHLMAAGEVGTVVVKDGPLMAASDRFKVTITGNGNTTQPNTKITLITLITLITQNVYLFSS